MSTERRARSKAPLAILAIVAVAAIAGAAWAAIPDPKRQVGVTMTGAAGIPIDQGFSLAAIC